MSRKYFIIWNTIVGNQSFLTSDDLESIKEDLQDIKKLKLEIVSHNVPNRDDERMFTLSEIKNSFYDNFWLSEDIKEDFADFIEDLLSKE